MDEQNLQKSLKKAKRTRRVSKIIDVVFVLLTIFIIIKIKQETGIYTSIILGFIMFKTYFKTKSLKLAFHLAKEFEKLKKQNMNKIVSLIIVIAIAAVLLYYIAWAIIFITPMYLVYKWYDNKQFEKLLNDENKN